MSQNSPAALHSENIDIRTRKIEGFSWPDGKKCAVVIGWHVDGEAGPIAADRRNANHIAALSEGAYGVSTALPRILELHRNLEIPASFFIPGYVADLHPDVVETVLHHGHEVAHHGYRHENVFLLDDEQEREVFQQGLETLQRLTGRKPLGWSAPGWGVKAHTLELLAELGMIYDASLMEYDVPYLISTKRGELVELPISLILDDWEIFGGSLFPNGGGVNAPAETAYQIWREEFEGMRHFGALFNTTFHPNLLGRPGRIKMLSRLFSYMRSFDDVWWATAEEVASYIRSMPQHKEIYAASPLT
jgi:peptidoglycan/xylan/chitin deacetylase (PgdA/CDA1 family)